MNTGRRRSSGFTLSSHLTDNDNPIITIEQPIPEGDLKELYRLEKVKQYHCINKLEQQYNTPNLQLINTLQDVELNELNYAVDHYLYLCAHKVHKCDSIFNVNLDNFNFNLRPTSMTQTEPKSKQPSFDFYNSTKSEIDELDDEKTIVMDSIVNLDFFRNGLRCGPIQTQVEIKPAPPPAEQPNQAARTVPSSAIDRHSAASLPKITPAHNINQDIPENRVVTPKPNTYLNPNPNSHQSLQPNPALTAGSLKSSSQATFKPQNTINTAVTNNTSTTKDTVTINKQLIIYKYLLVFDLNKKYFEIDNLNQQELLHTIKMLKKPQKWSSSDYEQLSLELKQSTDIFGLFNGMSKKKEKSMSSNNATNVPKTRYLNSKAIFDRLFRHFTQVLNSEWPESHLKPFTHTPATAKTRTKSNTNPSRSNAHQLMHRFQIVDGSKTIDLRNNQIRIGFKWNGVKFKDLDIIIMLNIGIKYRNVLIDAKVDLVLLDLLNKFVKNNSGGFYQNLKKTPDLKTLNKMCLFMSTNLKIKFDAYYLVPNLVHHWSLNFKHIKINFLKCLIFINCMNPTSIGITIINDLLNGDYAEKKERVTFAQAAATKNGKSGAGPPPPPPTMSKAKANAMNFMANLTNTSSLYLLVKTLQIFIFITFNQLEMNKIFVDENLSEEDLILEVILNEIGINEDDHDAKWSVENLFDRIWNCLMRIRYSLLHGYLQDTFDILHNVVPSMFIRYIVQFEVSNQSSGNSNNKRYSSLSRSSSVRSMEGKNQVNVSNKFMHAIESTMKSMLTTIITDEMNVFTINMLPRVPTVTFDDLINSQSKSNITISITSGSSNDMNKGARLKTGKATKGTKSSSSIESAIDS